MQVNYYPFGPYQTNCYTITNDSGESLIIDPGMGADDWIFEECKNPIAILNTHGHFDHIWSNASIKSRFKIPLYIHKNDAFMLQNDPFEQGTPKSEADFLIDSDKSIRIGNFEVSFKHFSGHTPGSMTIEIGDYMFSGDFVFKGTIGRYDFPYSSEYDMIESIQKFLKLDYDKIIYPGHGDRTTIQNEKPYLKKFLKFVL